MWAFLQTVLLYYLAGCLAYLTLFIYCTEWVLGARFEEWKAAATKFEKDYGLVAATVTLFIGYWVLALAWPYLVWCLIMRKWRTG